MDKHTEECTNCSWDNIFPEDGISHFETEQEKHDRIAAYLESVGFEVPEGVRLISLKITTVNPVYNIKFNINLV